MATQETPAVGGAGLISTETAAKLLMVSIEWIRRLTRDGAIQKVGKDQYRVVDVVQGYITYLRDENRKTSKSAAASRIQDARADEIKMRLDEKRGAHLADAQSEAISIIDEYGGELRANINAIPARITNDLPTRRKMENLIDGAFAAAAKRAIGAADRIEASGRNLGAKGKNKRGPVGEGKPGLSAKPRSTGSA